MHTNWIPRHRPRRWRWLATAPLTACLTAACASAPSTGGTAASASASASAATAPLNCAPPGVKLTPCYSPRAYEVAYGVAPLLSRGIDGSGETVVMPELASSRPPPISARTWSRSTAGSACPRPSCTS